MTGMTRTAKPRSGLITRLALMLATVAAVGATNLAPAQAWYDANGYWHPARHTRGSHQWWCEHHPYGCGHAPRGGYSYAPHGGYSYGFPYGFNF